MYFRETRNKKGKHFTSIMVIDQASDNTYFIPLRSVHESYDRPCFDRYSIVIHK